MTCAVLMLLGIVVVQALVILELTHSVGERERERWGR